MASYSLNANGEVITCSYFFDFWFYYINYTNKTTTKHFSQIIRPGATVDSITEFFGYYPRITVKIISVWGDSEELEEPCAIFSFCQSCYDEIMSVADLNKITFEKTKEVTCSDPHELYYSSRKKMWCDYCSLKGCFAKTVRVVFTTIDDRCLLDKKK